jgi:hypothetical protein
MKFSFVEMSCRIQLEPSGLSCLLPGNKFSKICRIIFNLFSLPCVIITDNFHSFATVTRGNCRRNKYSYNEIKNFRQFRTLSLYLLLLFHSSSFSTNRKALFFGFFIVLFQMFFFNFYWKLLFHLKKRTEMGDIII